VGVLWHVETALQAQRQKLFFSQFARLKALHLITELRDSLMHDGTVVFVVLVHRHRPHQRLPYSRGRFDARHYPPMLIRETDSHN